MKEQVKEKSAKEKPPKPKKYANQCLLLKTPDRRSFFTEEKNFPVLVEFGRTFDAEISVVKTKEQVEVLDLDDLAKSICSQTEDKQAEYDVLEVKLSAPVRETSENRESKLKKAKEVIDQIKTDLRSGKTISLADLESKFPDVAKSSLTNYFTRARRELASQGNNIRREKPGFWRVANELKPDHGESLLG
jgi:hypothetical protein